MALNSTRFGIFIHKVEDADMILPQLASRRNISKFNRGTLIYIFFTNDIREKLLINIKKQINQKGDQLFCLRRKGHMLIKLVKRANQI